MSEDQAKPLPDANAIADAISTLARAVAGQDLLVGDWLLALKMDRGGILPLRCVLAIGDDACEALEDGVKAAVKAGTIPPVVVSQAATVKPEGSR